MPKIVDHEQRRIQIAEATWRVILNQGMEGASVRNIAKEAGLSLGALRHYFSTQEELLTYAMKLVKETVTTRINAIAASELPPKEKVIHILLELIPINETTKAEMEVWFAFTFHTRHKQDILGVYNDGIFTGVKAVLSYLLQHQLLRPEFDIDIEAEKLYALVDGIALHALLEPYRINKERVEAVLISYLQSICIE